MSPKTRGSRKCDDSGGGRPKLIETVTGASLSNGNGSTASGNTTNGNGKSPRLRAWKRLEEETADSAVEPWERVSSRSTRTSIDTAGLATVCPHCSRTLIRTITDDQFGRTWLNVKCESHNLIDRKRLDAPASALEEGDERGGDYCADCGGEVTYVLRDDVDVDPEFRLVPGCDRCGGRNVKSRTSESRSIPGFDLPPPQEPYIRTLDFNTPSTPRDPLSPRRRPRPESLQSHHIQAARRTSKAVKVWEEPLPPLGP
jgi:hypothetical protein